MRRVLVAMVIAVTAGCASAPRAPHAPPPPAPAAAPANTPLPVVSPPRYSAGRAAYEITAVATIGLGADSLAHADSVTTTVVLRYDAMGTSRGLDLTGTVLPRFVMATPSLRPATITPADPVPFAATVDSATSAVRFATDTAGVPTCPMPRSGALDAARQFLLAIPRSLAPGASWTDTVVTATCRGEIPVTTTAVRRFTVSLEHPPGQRGPAILVARQSTAELRGTALHRNQPVALHGTGTGSYQDHYDAFTGRLLHSAGTSDIVVAVGTTGRETTIREHVEQRVTPLTPP